MKTLTIRRSKWGRGKTGGSLLRSSSGKMCCLGFLSRQIGATRGEIAEVACPIHLVAKLSGKRPKHAKTLKDRFSGLVIKRSSIHGPRETDVCGKLMVINDTEAIPEDQRESRLSKLFARIGWRVRFVN